MKLSFWLCPNIDQAGLFCIILMSEYNLDPGPTDFDVGPWISEITGPGGTQLRS